MAEIVSWRCTRSLTGFYDDSYRLVGMSPDGSKLVGERGDGKRRKAWNLRTGKLMTAVELWHSHTGELLRTLQGHSDWVNSVAFSPNGQLLASGSRDNTIKLWHPHTGELLRTLPGDLECVYSVALSADGQLLASGGADKTIKLWHSHTLHPVPVNCHFPVTSPDRSLLVKPNYDETTEKWNLEIIDTATKQLLQTLPGHSGSIEQVIFSEDSNTMVSLGGDLVIKVWRQGEE